MVLREQAVVALVGLALVELLTGAGVEATRPAAEQRRMKAFVTEVLAMTGLHNDVRVVLDPEAKGCAYAATVLGRQVIGVDLDCVGPLATGAGYNWRAVGALTHEVGHLLGGHTTNGGHSLAEESEADEWAGWAMYRLGADLSEAQTFFRTVSARGSKSHPARDVRLASIARGWNRARAAGGGVIATRPPPELPAPSPEPPAETSSWAAFLQRPLPWR